MRPLEHLNEATLVERARVEPEAFGELYQRYVDRIYSYVYYRVGSHEEAEDLTARTFFQALDNLAAYEDRGAPFSAWLYRIAHNLIIDEARYEQRRPAAELHEWLSLPPDSHPDAVVGRRLESDRLRQAIQQLTSEQRDVIVLRFGEGMTAPQAARILGKTEEAVRALQRRALSNLRRLLAPASNDPEAAADLL